MKTLPVGSEHKLYENVRFRRSSVFPPLLFLGTDQNGMTVNENATADKISSIYRKSWNIPHLPRKLSFFEDFVDVGALTHLLSGVILHFIKIPTQAPWTSKSEILFLITSWSQLRCCAICHLKEFFQSFIFFKVSWLLASRSDTNFNYITECFISSFF